MYAWRMQSDESIEGLRARKKRETRSALAWAAVRLAVERGFANVPVEDIAAGAGVSPRTFNNYFSSKAEAIVARHVDRLQAIAAELRALPHPVTLWKAITEAVVAQFSGEEADEAPPRPQWSAGVKLMLSEPAVQAELLRQSHNVEQDIAAAISLRIGGDPDAIYPHLVAAAVGAVIQVSVERWMSGDQQLSLPQVMRNAFDRMGRIADASPTASGRTGARRAPAP
jgi:AcrR family transcriptional regulator